MLKGVRARLAACLLASGLAGCVLRDRPAPLREFPDPCLLVTDEVLERLAPGAQRVPQARAFAMGSGGSKRCDVRLETGTSSMRGDLKLEVTARKEGYTAAWREEQCAGIRAEPGPAGPGDVSCVAVRAWDGSQTRVDGSAWVGKDYEVQVAYQLVEPQALPAGAEQELRHLLEAAVASLPAP